MQHVDSFWIKIWQNDVARARDILAQKPDAANQDHRGFDTQIDNLFHWKWSAKIPLWNCTPLMLASLHGHIEMMELLLDNNAAINTQCSEGLTPLLLALYGRSPNSLAAAKLLLSREADVNLCGKGMLKGVSPLVCAVTLNTKNGSRDEIIASLLGKGAKTDYPGQIISALYCAAENDDIKTMQMLLAKNALIEARGSHFGFTPFLAAVSEGAFQAADLLLQHGADANARDIMERNAFNLCGGDVRRAQLAALLEKHRLRVVRKLAAAAAGGLRKPISAVTKIQLPKNRRGPK